MLDAGWYTIANQYDPTAQALCTHLYLFPWRFGHHGWRFGIGACQRSTLSTHTRRWSTDLRTVGELSDRTTVVRGYPNPI